MYIRVNTIVDSSLRSGILENFPFFKNYLLLQTPIVGLMKFLGTIILKNHSLFELQFILRNFLE